MKNILAALLAVGLSACALPPTKLYSGEVTDRSTLTAVSWHNTARDKGLWGIGVDSVGGKSVNLLSTDALIEPGEYIVKITCFKEYNPGGVKIDGVASGKGEKLMKLEAGTRYFLQGKIDYSRTYVENGKPYRFCEPVVYKRYYLK